MLTLLARSAAAVVILTVVFGFAYPGAMTGIAQLAFPNKSDGSIVEVDGEAVGSRLAAQAFARADYFHPRPSTTGYNAAGTSFSNYGPTSAELAGLIDERADAILALESPYNPELTRRDIPVDAVTASGSGIDPHISPAYARLQAPRIAQERGLSLKQVDRLIGEATDGRWLGFLGEPGVNVLELNLLLDEVTR